LNLVENSVIYTYGEYIGTVSFNINVQGDELILEEMKVSWAPDYSENLNKTEIQ